MNPGPSSLGRTMAGLGVGADSWSDDGSRPPDSCTRRPAVRDRDRRRDGFACRRAGRRRRDAAGALERQRQQLVHRPQLLPASPRGRELRRPRLPPAQERSDRAIDTAGAERASRRDRARLAPRRERRRRAGDLRAPSSNRPGSCLRRRGLLLQDSRRDRGVGRVRPGDRARDQPGQRGRPAPSAHRPPARVRARSRSLQAHGLAKRGARGQPQRDARPRGGARSRRAALVLAVPDDLAGERLHADRPQRSVHSLRLHADREHDVHADDALARIVGQPRRGRIRVLRRRTPRRHDPGQLVHGPRPPLRDLASSSGRRLRPRGNRSGKASLLVSTSSCPLDVLPPSSPGGPACDRCHDDERHARLERLGRQRRRRRVRRVPDNVLAGSTQATSVHVHWSRLRDALRLRRRRLRHGR